MRYAIALVAVFGFVNALPAQAQQYPAKPIRLIVPFVAGGSADVLSRVLAQRLNQQYGQQVVVENRPGSGGHVGAEAAARAAPDGYTIVFGTIGIHAAYTIYSKLNYDPSRDLQPVSMYADVPNILVVHPSVPVKNVKEFIALAKSNPGRLNFGTAGSGSSTHMAGEWFKLYTGVNLTHVPYKGSAQAMQDLLGGQIELMFAPTQTVIPQLQSGRLKAIAVTGTQPLEALPGVPTVAASGLSGYQAQGWFGLLAPKATPPAVVARLHDDVNKILALPEVRKDLIAKGAEPGSQTAAEFGRFIADEQAKWARLVKEAGIVME